MQLGACNKAVSTSKRKLCSQSLQEAGLRLVGIACVTDHSSGALGEAFISCSSCYALQVTQNTPSSLQRLSTTVPTASESTACKVIVATLP